MKGMFRDFIIALFIGIILPFSAVRMEILWMDTQTVHQENEINSPGTEESEYIEQTPKLKIRFRGVNGVCTMEMDEYLLGAVLAEMPSYFELEALKAQAVAARTYSLKAYETGGKHGDSSVCGSYACCQAYISVREYIEKGGTEESVQKVRQAVNDTSGYVLTYDGILIDATYFSCSGGKTEDAAAVWGTEIPYLQSVESLGEEHAAHFSDVVYFSPSQFSSLLGVTLPDDPQQWLGNISYTEGGGVDWMELGGVIFSGTQLRNLLNLRSTAFSITISDQEIAVMTRGYGHRVGMSQYGADAMAVNGSLYPDILAHYYPGTRLEIWGQ